MQGKHKYLIDKMLKHVPFYPIFQSDEKIELVTNSAWNGRSPLVGDHDSIYTSKYVYFWILQRRLARHWGAGVIHAGSRRGYLEKISQIELCMVDKGFQGMQYQKTTLASNPNRD
jgi:hypothetical protein